MRGSRVLAASGIAGLALVLVGIGISSASAGASSVERDIAPLAPAATIVVTSTADSGPGTLRQALTDAVNGDVIGFDTGVFPLASPATIALSSALPEIIIDDLTIDASNVGVILDGNGTPVDTDGLVINGASSVTVKGLQVLGFPSDGIVLRDGAMSNTVEDNVISGNGENGMAVFGSGTMSNTISGNTIGTDASGTTTMTNQHSGISMWSGSSYNIIEDNLISGNGGDGIGISGSGTTYNVVRGNTIGTDVSGSFALPNDGGGVLVEGDATYNVIGGNVPGERNLISGNNQDGIDINGSGTMSNTVSGNYIGTDISGTLALGNGDNGVQVGEGASYNLIGGDTEGERNLISGNANIGVSISDSGTMSNTVSGNYIGTDISGTEGLGNYEGVRIDEGASGNVIGGDTAGERNLISGNRYQGVSIHGSGTTSNTVSGNYIGTDVNGTAIISSTASKGFFIASGASYNLIGGSNGSPGGACTGGCNLISGYSEAGVSINWPGAMSNTVSGNYIGTNVTGTVALGNGSGVIIGHGATYNLIGGDSPAERNLISGNNEHGVAMYFSGTMSNTVHGNYIGTDPSGTMAVANGADGAHMNQASHNWVIGNLLSGNAGSGASLCCGSDTSYNAISSNTIGLDISGTAIVSNGYCGVSIGGGPVNNLIGGDTPNERNLISGNGECGVLIDSADTMSNTVSGNYIGTDITGTAALGNGTATGGWGVVIADGASHNTIGGTTAGERNLISGNGDLFCGPPGSAYAIGGGIRIYNMATGNGIQGNTIGMDVTGLTPIPNGMVGIGIEDSPGNLIGGTDPGAGNLISGNSCGGPPPPRAGIRLFGDGTTVQGNVIGLDANGANFFQEHNYYDNGDQGIFVSGSNNLIEGNTIAGNAGFGIYMHGSSTVRNTVTHNAIYSHTNEGAGISLNNGANDYMFPPLLTEVSAASVRGIAVPGATVEVFSDDDDEGRWYHGSTVADASGHFTFTAVAPFTGTNVTATATDQDGNTSEFSSPYHPARDLLVAAVYVPQQRHQVNVSITPTVRVGNGGTAAETFTVTAVITRSSDGAQVYSATKVVMNLGVFNYRTLTLPAWTPSDLGGYTFEVLVQTGAPDDDPSNDRRAQVFVVADDRVDVWARDHLTDDGREPSTGSSWQSPDVWVRNAADGGTTYQDPINAITNTVYLTVRNRGTLTATDVVVTVYWHPPALVIGQSWWQPIDTAMLAELAPGATEVVSMAWSLNIQGLTGPYHTCLLGVLTATEDLAPVVWDVRGSNNIVQRNVDVIPQQEAGGGMDLDLAASSAVSSTFDVGNPYPGEQLVDVLVDALGVPAGGELWIDLGGLFERWEQVGQGSLVGAAHVNDTTVITVAGGTQAEITGIPMAGEELFEVVVEIHGLDGGQSTQIDVSERIGGDVLGGITLEVTAIEYKVYLPLVLRDH